MATLPAMTCREPAGSLRGCNLFRLLHVGYKEECRAQGLQCHRPWTPALVLWKWQPLCPLGIRDALFRFYTLSLDAPHLADAVAALVSTMRSLMLSAAFRTGGWPGSVSARALGGGSVGTTRAVTGSVVAFTIQSGTLRRTRTGEPMAIAAPGSTSPS